MVRQLLGMLMLEVTLLSVPAQPQLILQQSIPDFRPKFEIELSSGDVVSRTSIVEVKAHDGIDGDLVNMCYDELEHIPDCYLNKFNSLGWELCVVDYDIDANILGGMYGSVTGVTVCLEHRIYLEDRVKAIHEATLHEFGHFVDYMYDDWVPQSNCEEFQSIYYEEKDKSGFGSYACSQSTEWFAELFWQVYTNPTVTSEKCPRGYDYVKRMERSLCEELLQ